MVDETLVLLVSGGIDSTALLDFYLKRKEKPHCIHYNYDQLSSKSEQLAIKKISEHYGVDVSTIDLQIPMANRGDEILCRNALFILTAASLGYSNSRISIGIHSDSTYYDATERFVSDCQTILDGYFSGTVRIEVPFINYTKADIIDYCKNNNVPMDLTYSCLRKNDPPCEECPSCLDRVNM